jgi:uncharacterized membrane protein
MQLWFILAISGFMISAISSIIDKYVMNQQCHPVTTCQLRTLLNAVFLGTAGLIFLNLQLTFSLLLLATIPAFLLAASFTVYLKVLQKKKTSQIQPFSQSLDTLFIFLASIAFLHETVTWENDLGIVIVVIGIYLVLAERISTIPRLDSGLLLITALVPLDVAYALLLKTYMGTTEPITLAVAIYIMAFFMLSIISLFLRRRRTTTPPPPRPQLPVIALSSLFAATAIGLLYTALSMADATKVFPMGGINSIMVFLLATLLLKERFHWYRLLGTIIVVIGIYLISL